MDDSILDTIGSPLVSVDAPSGATIAAKLESRNPGGSAKDRAALWMIAAAERDGELREGWRSCLWCWGVTPSSRVAQSLSRPPA